MFSRADLTRAACSALLAGLKKSHETTYILLFALDQFKTLVDEFPPASTNSAFQAGAAAVVSVLEQILAAEKAMNPAVISLGQQTRLDEMIASVTEMLVMVNSCLDERGKRLVVHSNVVPNNIAANQAPTSTSWFAAVDITGQQISEKLLFLNALSLGQSHDSDARRLFQGVISLLARHQDQLQEELARCQTN